MPKRRNPWKTVLFLGKHRVTPCRKQRWAPFPARLEPLGTTRGPAFVTEPGIAMGLGAGARKRQAPLPGPPDLLLCARTDLCRSPPMRRAGPPLPRGRRGPTRRRPMDRAGPSAPKTGDYVGMGCPCSLAGSGLKSQDSRARVGPKTVSLRPVRIRGVRCARKAVSRDPPRAAPLWNRCRGMATLRVLHSRR